MTPSYHGAGLVNLIASIERGLRGDSAWTGLSDSTAIGAAPTVVLVVFDGLGVAQLQHSAATSLKASMLATLEAPFPTTTSVSKATIASGLPPSQHGLSAHLAWMGDIGEVVNTLKWVTPTGGRIDYDYARVLPAPNLWERLSSSGIESVVIEPGAYHRSPLSQVLFRGARFEGYWNHEEIIEATIQLASVPNRLIVTYLPDVDFAGHVYGLGSSQFAESISLANSVWERLCLGLGDQVLLLGTADHGLVEFDESNKVLVRDSKYDQLRFAGDPRGLQLWGPTPLMEDLASETGGILVDPGSLIGPDPLPTARGRLGDKVLLPPDHLVLLPRGFDKRLRCYHGGLSRAEVEIPLLVR